MPKHTAPTAEQGPGSFDVWVFGPGEASDVPSKLNAMRDIMKRSGILWGLVAAPMETSELVMNQTFGAREVVAGTMWAALAVAAGSSEEERVNRSAWDIMLDEARAREEELEVMALLDVVQLEVTRQPSGDISGQLYAESQIRLNPLHLWRPRGTSLDDATVAVFAFQQAAADLHR